MKILFLARHHTYFRNFDSALRVLARQGHRIHLAVEQADTSGGLRGVEALARECPEITHGVAPGRAEDRDSELARRLRLGLDYLRYLEPFYDDESLRRVRARERTPRALVRLTDPPLLRSRLWRKIAGRCLHALDRAIAPSAAIVEFLREQKPDVLLITPYVDLGSQQVDYLRAARKLGIPTALAVWSWDHLSSKAYIRECPERVFVWNDTQKREAIDVHGVPGGRVLVTGAQCFDHWFERVPSRTRDEFCRALNLPGDRPMVLYVCSALIMGSPSEAAFVRDWLTRLRASSDSRLATAAVLVRPHPAQMFRWEGVDLSDLGPVAVWGSNPVDEDSRAAYFDSLYYSAAVVGLNTSAFIEAGIVGRPVLTILPAAFHDNQEGTVHFRYLLEIGGGLLRVSRDFDAHFAQLADALVPRPDHGHPFRVFLESFVRPRGLDVPATPAFVEAVESLARCAVDPSEMRQLSPSPWMRALHRAVSAYAADPASTPAFFSDRELEQLRRRRANAERKASIDAAKLDHKRSRKAQYAEERAQARRAARLARERAGH